jgi:hypothetical protein
MTPISMAPTRPMAPPTLAPTMAPTLRCDQDPDLRSLLIRVVLSSVSSSADLEMDGSPQNMAQNWLINQDMRFLCPEDPTLKRRYALAVFYYSTRGDRWSQCKAPENFVDPGAIQGANLLCTIEGSIPGSGSDAWLSPGSECLWGGVVCDQNFEVQWVDLGTYVR